MSPLRGQQHGWWAAVTCSSLQSCYGNSHIMVLLSLSQGVPKKMVSSLQLHFYHCCKKVLLISSLYAFDKSIWQQSSVTVELIPPFATLLTHIRVHNSNPWVPEWHNIFFILGGFFLLESPETSESGSVSFFSKYFSSQSNRSESTVILVSGILHPGKIASMHLLDYWQSNVFGMGPLYLFRISNIYGMSFCFRVLFTSASTWGIVGVQCLWFLTSHGFSRLFTCLPFGIAGRGTAQSMCCNLVAILLFIRAHICWGALCAGAPLKFQADINSTFLNVHKFDCGQSYPGCSIQTSLSTLALIFSL